jgi:beta-phosphoglucomutase
MAQFKAAIFDLDGVIVSTDHYHRLGWERLARELGIPFTDEQARRTRGVDRMASLRVVLGPDHRFSPAEMNDLAARKNAYYTELIRQITPADLLPGALDLLAELEAHAIPRAIGSASKNAAPVLELLGIAPRFDAVVTGHDFERGKPAPDVFLTAARRLHVAPANCLVFEDAEAGIQAAHAGGMKAVGIGRPETVPDAERIVSSLAEIHYADLVALMRNSTGEKP